MTLPPCPTPQVVEEVASVGVSALGHRLGGMGVVSLDGDSWSLLLLSPGGLELFSVTGPPQVVVAALPEWAPWIERMPIGRDLWMVYAEVPEGGCAAPEGELRVRGDRVRWRGEGGPAVATRGEGSVEVRDRRRHYRLVVARAP